VRQITAILLIAVLATNWYGYDLLLPLLNNKENNTIAANFANGAYQENELLEIKVDLELPYATDWTSFEKINGTIVVQGVIYNFVERKMENGHMVYHCLPNYKSTALQNARDYFHTLVYNMEKQEDSKPVPASQHTKKLNLETTVLAFENVESIVANVSSAPKAFPIGKYAEGFTHLPSQPPEA
jgi:hypothetical protein